MLLEKLPVRTVALPPPVSVNPVLEVIASPEIKISDELYPSGTLVIQVLVAVLNEVVGTETVLSAMISPFGNDTDDPKEVPMPLKERAPPENKR